MPDAVVSPLLILVAIDGAVIGLVRNAQVGEHPLVWLELRQYAVANTLAEHVCLLFIDLDAEGVIAHLPYHGLAQHIKALDDLKRRFPIPYVGGELVVLRTHVDKCETHIYNRLRQG